jgi:hypothetical protein
MNRREAAAFARAVKASRPFDQIRRLLADGSTQRSVAKLFGVHFGTINNVAIGRTWRHVLL